MTSYILHQVNILLGVTAIAFVAYVYQSRILRNQMSQVPVPVKVRDK